MILLPLLALLSYTFLFQERNQIRIDFLDLRELFSIVNNLAWLAVIKLSNILLSRSINLYMLLKFHTVFYLQSQFYMEV